MKDILKLIETVDPADTAKLDEIDLAFWRWFTGLPIKEASDGYEGCVDWSFEEEYWDREDCYSHCYSYNNVLPDSSPLQKVTRSRDALKAIRPEGYRFKLGTNNICGDYTSPAMFYTEMYNGKFVTEYVADFPTEELAELHAIIQAIEFEREHQCLTKTK